MINIPYLRSFGDYLTKKSINPKDFDLKTCTQEKEKKMLIEYIRDAKRNPIACICCIDEDHIGVSVNNPHFITHKRMLLEVAKGRAERSRDRVSGVGYPKRIPNRKAWISEANSCTFNGQELSLEDAIHDCVVRMKEKCRSLTTS